MPNVQQNIVLSLGIGVAVVGCARGEDSRPAESQTSTSGMSTQPTGTTATASSGPGSTTTGPGASDTGTGADGGLTTSPVSTSGTTGGNCNLPWRTKISTATLYGLDVDGGKVYVVGQNESGQGHVAVLDACNGTIEGSVPIGPGNMETVWTSAAVVDDAVYLTGWTVPGIGFTEGVYGRLEEATLSPEWMVPIAGSAEKKDLFRRILPLSSGRLWMIGKQGTGVNQRVWFGSGTQLGQACGFTWGGQSGDGYVLIEGQDVVYAVVNRGVDVVLLHFDPTCTCGCAPVFTSAPFAIGAAGTEVFDGVLLSDTLYLAGRAYDNAMVPDFRSFVAAVDAATGTLTAQVTDNPSNLIESHQGIVTNGSALLLGGVIKWQGTGYFGAGIAHLWVYDLPLITGNQPVWDTDLSNLDAVVAVARDPSTGWVFLAGEGPGMDRGVVLGCDEDWGCS